MKATKGPWSYAYPGIYSSYRKVCEIDGNNYHGENIANARLISCAPEMLAILKEVYRFSFATTDQENDDLHNKILDIIRKAEQQ